MKAPSNCTTCKQHVSLHMFLLTIKDNDLRNYFYIICIIANVFINVNLKTGNKKNQDIQLVQVKVVQFTENGQYQKIMTQSNPSLICNFVSIVKMNRNRDRRTGVINRRKTYSFNTKHKNIPESLYRNIKIRSA